jgi:hypothetical protein
MAAIPSGSPRYGTVPAPFHTALGLQPGAVTSVAFVVGGRLRARLPFGPNGWMLSAVGILENTMSKAGLDNRHRNHDGEISHKHGNTLIGTLANAKT